MATLLFRKPKAEPVAGQPRTGIIDMGTRYQCNAYLFAHSCPLLEAAAKKRIVCV